MASSTLKSKTISGLFWSFLDNVFNYLIAFVIGIVLARLLSPDDYGLLGLIAIFTAISNVFINSGFSSALIRKKVPTANDYNTVFFCNFFVSIIVYVLLFMIAPYISAFFERSELVLLIRVSCIGLIIGSLSLVQRTRLSKDIDFKTQTKINLFSSIIGGVIGIILAIMGFGVWALVYQGLISSLFSFLANVYFNRWIPKLHFHKESFMELFGYSWKLVVSNLLSAIWEQLYLVVIGKFYSPSILGQYTRATGFSNLLSSNLNSVVQRVTFPVLSELQEDKVALKSAYRKMIKTTMFVTFVGMLLLAAIAKPMIFVLIGNKWAQSAEFLQLICFTAILYPLHSINLSILQVEGRSDLYLRLEIIKKVIAVFPLLCGIFIGIYWMLLGSIITGVLAYFCNAYYSAPLLNYSFFQQIKDVLPSFCLAFCCLLPIYLLSFLPISGFIILPIQVLLSIILIYLVAERIQLEEYKEVKGLILKAYQSLRSKLKYER